MGADFGHVKIHTNAKAIQMNQELGAKAFTHGSDIYFNRGQYSSPSALYEVFEPEEAKRIWDRFEFIYTPKHGSWLNMAEVELNVLNGQCLNRRIDKIETVKEEVKAWCISRNNMKAKINWQFTTKDARIKLKVFIKLKPLVPELDSGEIKREE